MIFLANQNDRAARISRLRALLFRHLRPAALGVGLAAAATGCTSTTTFDYLIYDPMESGPLESCDMACGEMVSTCRIIEDCDEEDAQFVEACGVAAGQADGAEQVVECRQYEWVYAGPSGVGRLPLDGSSEPAMRGRSTGDYFAEMARFEGLAADAFDELAEHLGGHGAPTALVQRCRSAAEEERTHVELAGGLARRFGASVARGGARVRGERPTLLALARHNAVEGCVRETLGVLVLAEQARAAADAGVRAALAQIAVDEASHALLSWEIDRWAHERLSAGQRSIVEADRRAAIEELRGDAGRAMSGGVALEAWLGMPSPERRLQLIEGLRGAVGNA